jgi:hypothetical protein
MKRICIVLFLLFSIIIVAFPANALTYRIDYSGIVETGNIPNNFYEIKIGDTIAGAVIYDAETAQTPSIGELSGYFDSAILSNYFAFSNSSGVYLEGYVTLGRIALQNGSLDTTPTDHFGTTQMPFTGGSIAIWAYYPYNPSTFKLRIWERVYSNNLSEGFVSNVHHLITNIDTVDGGTVNIDWENDLGGRFYANIVMSSITGSVVPAPEPTTMLLLGLGLVGLAGVRRRMNK